MSLSSFETRVQQIGAQFGISLDTLRPHVSQLMDAIRTSGFFRTYTDHSIRHCAQMFTVLEWLIPQEVKRTLTDVECTLLVLSVYFHDLGMIATQKEFEERLENSGFESFREVYMQTLDEGAAFDADHPTPDHFIFEEYVRNTHAQRICDWLTGSISQLPQAQEVAKLLALDQA